MFAPKYLEKVAPLALQVIKNALGKAIQSHENGKVLHIQRLYTGITVDIIMQICFDKQLRLIESTEEEPPFLRNPENLLGRVFPDEALPDLDQHCGTSSQSLGKRIGTGIRSIPSTMCRMD